MMDGRQRRAARVLIVEDDATAVEFFEHTLVEAGYVVCAALTVSAGLAAATANTPDVVILDLHLPLMDGLECLRRMRAAPLCLKMPVAILTGDYFLDDDVVRELQGLGARIHFKPVWEDDLKLIVATLVPQRQGQLQ